MLPATEIIGINALPCGIGPIYQAYFLAGSIYAPDYNEKKSSVVYFAREDAQRARRK